jgi:hypothetical protein
MKWLFITVRLNKNHTTFKPAQLHQLIYRHEIGKIIQPDAAGSYVHQLPFEASVFGFTCGATFGSWWFDVLVNSGQTPCRLTPTGAVRGHSGVVNSSHNP